MAVLCLPGGRTPAPRADARTATPSAGSSVVTTEGPLSREAALLAVENVKDFYRQYLPSTAGDHDWVADGYLTEEAAHQRAAERGADIVTCSQNPLPFDRYSFQDPSGSENLATMTVVAHYDGGTDTTITLDLVQQD